MRAEASRLLSVYKFCESAVTEVALESMRILTLSSSPLSDKSFRIGLGVVVIFGAAEILSAAYYYVSRIHVSQAPLRPGVVAMRSPSVFLVLCTPSANE